MHSERQASRFTMRLFSTLAIAAVLAQVALGGAVRLTGSGLSCPDWPLCYGLWIPTPGALAAIPDLAYAYWQIWLEWLHRLNAAVIVGPLVLLVMLTARTPTHRILGGVAIALVVVQAFLGGVTVFDRNSPWSVTVHLVAAMLLLATLVGSSTGPERTRPDARILPLAYPTLAWTGTVLAIATVGAGAYLSKSGATHTCPEWLLCGSPWSLERYAQPDVLLHLVHRGLALLSLVPALILYWRLPRQHAPAALFWAKAVPLIFLVQVSLGLSVAMLEPSVPLALTHQFIGTLLVTAYAALGWHVVRER